MAEAMPNLARLVTFVVATIFKVRLLLRQATKINPAYLLPVLYYNNDLKRNFQAVVLLDTCKKMAEYVDHKP